MSDTTTESPATAPAGRAKGLSSMLLPELQAYAVSLGRTRDRYYLYRIGPETAGHLAEWVRWTRWAN